MQIRRIPAVTHIKILFVEHAQTKCLYALWIQTSMKFGTLITIASWASDWSDYNF